jgi:hypothetical protein
MVSLEPPALKNRTFVSVEAEPFEPFEDEPDELIR